MLNASLKSMMMFGQRACSAKRSIAVSSRADEAMAPAFVAPIARERASASSRALPVPSCSDETKQGKPLPLTYRLLTDEPIMLNAVRESGSFVLCQAGGGIPRRNHDDILGWLEVKELVEDVVTTGNDYAGIILQVRSDLIVEDARLDLVRNEEEDDCDGDMSSLDTLPMASDHSLSSCFAALAKSCSTLKPLDLASSA